MDLALIHAYKTLISLGYPKEPLSKDKFRSLAYRRLSSSPSFLSGLSLVKDLEAIDSLFLELADQAPLLAAKAKSDPLPYPAVDKQKPTFFLLPLFGKLSFVSAYFDDHHLDIDIDDDGYSFLDYRLDKRLIAYKGENRLFAFKGGNMVINQTKFALTQTGIEGIDVYPRSYLNGLDGEMPDPDCQLAMIMGGGRISQLDCFRPIEKEEAGILLLLLLSLSLSRGDPLF